MKVHFLSCKPEPQRYLEDASFRYRCENLAVALSNVGINTSLQHITEFTPEPDTTHVVFQRPRRNPRLKRLLKQLQIANITAIADFDDLVFDEDYALFSPASLNDMSPLKKVAKGYQTHFDALTLFEHITVSTETLRRHTRRLFKNINIHITHNYAHYKWPYKQPNRPAQRKHILTYFPGTRSHDRDFWQINDVLPEFLGKNQSVQLLVIGPLKSRLLNTRSQQIKHIAKLPFEHYIQAAANSWVNLLPLEPTPFNQCKSAIKVIEAATNLAPTICSPLPDAQRFVGKGALIANDETEWLTHLNKCLQHQHYKTMIRSMQENNKHTLAHQQMAIEFCDAFNITMPQHN